LKIFREKEDFNQEKDFSFKMFYNQGSLQTPANQMQWRDANGPRDPEMNIQRDNGGNFYSPHTPVNLMSRIETERRERELREILLSQRSRKDQRGESSSLYGTGRNFENFENRVAEGFPLNYSPRTPIIMTPSYYYQDRQPTMTTTRDNSIFTNDKNGGILHQQIILAEEIPKWEKFDGKSYQRFRSKVTNYYMNNGGKSIKEMTTNECKDQSEMFFIDLFGNSDMDIMKICDRHFRIDTKVEIAKKLKHLSMDERL